jgi:predicted SAM-dependent methyltransferase
MRLFIGSENPLNAGYVEEIFQMLSIDGLLLDVGCGGGKLDYRFVGVDAYSDSEDVNVQAFMWDMPFGDETVDGILCHQALEHVTKYHVPPTLKEFARVLKPGAKALILVPDLEWVIRGWLRNQINGMEMDQIFGLQNQPGEEHRTGFSQKIFASYVANVPELQLLGFHAVKAYSQLNLGAVIVKRDSINT